MGAVKRSGLESDLIPVRHYGTSGPTVTVLHGGPGAPGSARALAEALAPHFRVLEPLQRRSGPVPLTVDRHVEDLAAAAGARTAIVGWSWGAMLGLSYAARYPERVSALALVGCGTYDEPSRAAYKRTVAEQLGESGNERVDALRKQLEKAGSPADRNRILADMGAVFMDAETYDPLETVPDAEDLEPDHRGNQETWQDALRLQREGVEPARFTSITARVVMLHGDFDPHPGPATRDLLRRVVPQLEYVEFERCGHQPWRERHAREPFVTCLSRWLRESAVP